MRRRLRCRDGNAGAWTYAYDVSARLSERGGDDLRRAAGDDARMVPFTHFLLFLGFVSNLTTPPYPCERALTGAARW